MEASIDVTPVTSLPLEGVGPVRSCSKLGQASSLVAAAATAFEAQSQVQLVAGCDGALVALLASCFQLPGQRDERATGAAGRSFAGNGAAGSAAACWASLRQHVRGPCVTR